MNNSHSRSWTLWAAGSFAVLVLVALTVVITTWVVSDDRGGAAIDDPTRGPEQGVPQQCPTDTNASIPKRQPTGVDWQPINDEVPMEVPVSDRYGPCEITDTTASGYARTPRGAVLAATQIVIRASIPGPVGEDTIEGQVLPGTARDLLLDGLEDGDPERASDTSAAVAAFAIDSWSSDSAEVSLVTTHEDIPGEVLVFDGIRVVWKDGDWRMQAPPGGDWANVATRHDDMPTGFVRWGA